MSRETAGTKVLWSARPDAWGYARGRLQQAWLGIPTTAFGILWTWGATGGFSERGKSPPAFFALLGVMFILFGLCALCSPLFALWKAGRVFYVVTDRGALIIEKIWSLRIHSFDASGFGGFERLSHGDRGGDIVFVRRIERRGKGTSVTEVGFLGLRDFADAERALRSMMLVRRAADSRDGLAV